MWLGTGTILPVPRITSCIHVTSRVCIPIPHGLMHGENSLKFHLWTKIDRNDRLIANRIIPKLSCSY